MLDCKLLLFLLFLSMEIHASRPTVTDSFCCRNADTFIKKKEENEKNCEKRGENEVT